MIHQYVVSSGNKKSDKMRQIIDSEYNLERWSNLLGCEYIGRIDYDLRDHTYSVAANDPTKRSILFLHILFPDGETHTNFLLFYNSHVYRIEPHGRSDIYDEEYLDRTIRKEYPNHTYHSTKSFICEGPQYQENASGWFINECYYGFYPLDAYCCLWAMITCHLFLESLKRKVSIRKSLKELMCTQKDLHEYWNKISM